MVLICHHCILAIQVWARGSKLKAGRNRWAYECLTAQLTRIKIEYRLSELIEVVIVTQKAR